MNRVSFNFGGKQYSGSVVCSDQLEPHYYWFINSDQELIDQLGEDVAFVQKDGQLIPLNYTLAERHTELFGVIIRAIRDTVTAGAHENNTLLR